MKKLLLATTAFVMLAAVSANAADMAVRPAYAPPPAYSWTGLYWGVNIGYSWGKAKYDAAIAGVGGVSLSEDIDGVIGGGQSGYNYQFGAWVWGFETDLQASGQKGGSTFVGILPLTTSRPTTSSNGSARPAAVSASCGLRMSWSMARPVRPTVKSRIARRPPRPAWALWSRPSRM